MTPQLVIDKNIPQPIGTNRGPLPKYPFGQMQVGDSFFIQDCAGNMRQKIQSAASYYGLRHEGVRFTVRKVEGGIRVWRIAK